MANHRLSRASPYEGSSIARQVMNEAVDFYLANGGPAVARQEVAYLANGLKFYDDSREAYREAMARISLAEQAEQQKLMMSMMGVIKSEQDAKQSPAPRNTHPTTGPVTLPEKLSTPKAILMWQKLQQEGLIDDRYQPVGLSRTESALLAYEMSMLLADENDRLLDNKDWKPFEVLWNRKNMKADYYRATNLEKSSSLRDKYIKALTIHEASLQ